MTAATAGAAAIASLAFPGAAFLFAPLLLGVPHLLSDARHLLFRSDVFRSDVAGCAVATTLWPLPALSRNLRDSPAAGAAGFPRR